jgi:hypothetical protein
MKVLVTSLKKLGFATDADEIEIGWAELMKRMEPDPSPPEFHRCYPARLLDLCIDEVLAATREVGCDLAGPSMTGFVRCKLNEAWKEMWRSPATYRPRQSAAVFVGRAGAEHRAPTIKVFRSRDTRLRKPVSVPYRTGLKLAETEIGNWRAETGAVKPPVQT